ncbi:MAG TPA: GNAT family N-acetyltransferase [Anaerolineae bacterium]|nr:GNAT family N-acetyltransferase [Anaerolineae bacterium]
MTAAALVRSRTLRTGLRSIRPRRDMGAVAELIETAFVGQLDTDGQRMVREMRSLGKLGWLGWLISKFILPPFANPHGYVWEEDGRIVGSASLIPVEHFPRRWVLANVAVYPEYRRRGIARALVMSTIDKAIDLNARTLMLQVRSSQQGALHLYESLGFHTYSRRTVWRRPPVHTKPEHPQGTPIRKRSPEEWHAQWTLANRLHPEGLVWPFPLSPNTFRPKGVSQVLSDRSGRHWIWYEQGRLLGSLSARFLHSRGNWRLILMALPEERGRVEGPMVAAGLAALPRRSVVVLDYAPGKADERFIELGFQPKDTFVWMGMDLDSELRKSLPAGVDNVSLSKELGEVGR